MMQGNLSDWLQTQRHELEDYQIVRIAKIAAITTAIICEYQNNDAAKKVADEAVLQIRPSTHFLKDEEVVKHVMPQDLAAIKKTFDVLGFSAAADYKIMLETVGKNVLPEFFNVIAKDGESNLIEEKQGTQGATAQNLAAMSQSKDNPSVKKGNGLG